jgi:hypothetical protein
MVFLSYEKEEIKKLPIGSHIGQIADIQLKQFQNDSHEFLSIKFESKGFFVTDNFKLWEDNPNVRLKAKHKFEKLCESVGCPVKKSDNDKEKIKFDSSVLIGKECGFIYKNFSKDGKDIFFIETYYPIDSAFVNDDIPF